MGRLTPDERQRVSRAREAATRETLSRLAAASMHDAKPPAPTHRRRRLAAVGVILLMLGGGWFVSQSLVFHRPASLAEALWPRQ
jgi:hypothetical protein